MDRWILSMLIVCLFLAGFLSLFASSEPDGFESVAEELGFIELGEGKEVINSPMPDYTIPGIENKALSGSLAGLIGTIFIFISILGVAKILKER